MGVDNIGTYTESKPNKHGVKFRTYSKVNIRPVFPDFEAQESDIKKLLEWAKQEGII